MTEAVAKRAVSERGPMISYTEAEVDGALRLLAMTGGSPQKAVELLAAEGVSVDKETIRRWRDVSFPRRYLQIRQDLGRHISEEVAGRALERALQADEAQALYIEAAVENLNRVPPAHLAKSALALAQAKASDIEKAQTLRGLPNEIVETRDPAELVAILERLGVVEPEAPAGSYPTRSARSQG